MRKLFLFLTAALFSIGTWADATHANPATVTYGGKTFLDAANTPGNAGTDDVYLNYGVQVMNSNYSSWAWFDISDGAWSKSNNAYTLPTGAVGFCSPGSSSSSEFYGQINFKASDNSKTGQIDLYVTGLTEVGFIWKNNNTSNNRWMNYSIAEVASDGSIGTPRSKNGSTSTTDIQYDSISGLNGNKYYKVSMWTTGTSSSLLYTFTFKRNTCATAITTQPTGANLAIGDANPELSIVATNADSYAWKESSDGTSYNGVSTLGTEDEFTPEVNDAVQTKYYYCEVTSSCDGETVVKSNIVTVNVVASISYYTITLNPAGGTITDATGWTLNAGKYEKEVADGTEVALPEFTKANRSFKTWRNNADVDVASPITVTKDTVLTAIWTKTINNTIYSWEGAEGGATEVGGTVTGSADNLINQAQAGYYCLKIDGKADWSSNHVDITLSGTEKVKTGDKITYWGFYSKDKSASARPKMRDGNSPNAEIFNDGDDLPNLYSGGDPAMREFTVPADINTNKVQITRSQTGSNTWISKLEIIRPTAVEEANIATITFNSDGGSDVASIEVEKGKAAVKPADPTKAGSTFTGWYLNDVAYNWSSTVSANITLVAHWAVAYTVVYFNGADTLGVETVAVGSHPTASAITSARECYTFNGWKYNDAFVTLNTFAGESGAKYDFIGNWTANYAKSINLEDSVLTYSKKYGYAAALSAVNISSAGADALDSLSGSAYRNYPYLGLKYKTGTGIGILVKQGSTLRVRFGNVGANVTVTINGANAETKTSAQLANTHTDSTRVYEYSATSADALVKFTYSNSSALVLKQVMIDKEIVRVHIPALYTVTYNAGAGTCATETATVEFSTDKVILPEIATLPEGMQFDGWYDAATSGTLVGLAGAEYTPSANITLYAYYSKATALDNTVEETKAIKRIENGQVVIFKDGKYFNVLGIQIR